MGVEPKIVGFYPQNGWRFFMETHELDATSSGKKALNLDVSKNRGILDPKWMVKIMVPTL